MPDQLAELLAQMAEHLAHKNRWTIAEATSYVLERAIEARKEYRQAGAPLGDDDAGFARWLLTPRGHITPSA